MKSSNIENNSSTLYYNNKQLPKSIALYPLESILILPGSYTSLTVVESEYIKLIEDAIANDRIIGVVQFIPDRATVKKSEIYKIGSLVRIISFLEQTNGSLKISIQGICRFHCEKQLITNKPYQTYEIRPYFEDFYEDNNESACYREHLLDTFANYFDINNLEADWETIVQAPMKTLINGLSAHAPFTTKERQAILEASNLKERAQILIALAERFLMSQNGMKASDLQ